MSLLAPTLPLRARSSGITSREPDHALAWRIVLAGVLLIILAVRSVDLFRPFPGDGSMFIYMGRLTADGGGMGREMIDNKFPTVGLMMSGPWRLLGANWPAWVVMLTLLGIAGPLILARAAERYLGKESYWPTLLFGLIYLNFSYGVEDFHLEVIEVFFAAIAASSALGAICDDDPRDAFALGLACATAALLKPTELAGLGAFVLAAAMQFIRRPGRFALHVFAAALGAAIPAAVAFIYLSTADLLTQIPVISRQIAEYGANSDRSGFDFVKWFVVVMLLGFPLVIRAYVNRRDRIANRVPFSIFAYAILWLMIEAVGVSMQGRMYKYHFLILTPPATLLFALIPREASWKACAGALALPAVVSLLGAIPNANEVSAPRQLLPASEYLLTHARPGDAVWADAEARLLDETGLNAGSRFLTTFIWSNSDDAPARFTPMLIDDLQTRRPKYIVLSTDLNRHINGMIANLDELAKHPRRAAGYRQAWRQISGYIATHYRAQATVGSDTVYRRIDSATK